MPHTHPQHAPELCVGVWLRSSGQGEPCLKLPWCNFPFESRSQLALRRPLVKTGKGSSSSSSSIVGHIVVITCHPDCRAPSTKTIPIDPVFKLEITAASQSCLYLRTSTSPFQNSRVALVVVLIIALTSNRASNALLPSCRWGFIFLLTGVKVSDGAGRC